MREYVETQVKQSQLSVENLKDDMKFHQSMSMSQSGFGGVNTAKRAPGLGESMASLGGS